MKIHAPSRVLREELDDTEVVVNFFAGSERSVVELRIDEGPWHRLTRDPRPDPHYLEIGVRETDWLPRDRRLPPPVDSPHLWVGPLPEMPASDAHVLEVRAADPVSGTHLGRHVMRVD